jgi:Transposase IS116/IS110/IS902 family
LLMTRPGVGPITSMAFVLTIGDVSRFLRGKQVASYLGLIPREYSSGGQQRLGAISKQGNTFLRMLLVEAAQGAVRCDESFRNEYLHRCHRKPKGVAKVAAARKLSIRLYWMLRSNTKYPQMAGETIFSLAPKTDSSREFQSLPAASRLRSQPLWHHAMLQSTATEKCCLTTSSLSSRGTLRGHSIVLDGVAGINDRYRGENTCKLWQCRK